MGSMMTIYSFLFVSLCICLQLTVVDSVALPKTRQRRHYPDDTHWLSPSSLNLHGQYNVCQDPVHNGAPVVNPTRLTLQDLVHGRGAMRRFLHKVKQAKRSLERTDIPRIVQTTVAEQDLSDFVTVSPGHQHANNVTMMYRQLAEAMLLLRVLHSNGARFCCIHLPNLNVNIVMNLWFDIQQSRFGQTISLGNCVITANAVQENLLHCQDIRDFVHLILDYGIAKLQEAIHMIEDLSDPRRWPTV